MRLDNTMSKPSTSEREAEELMGRHVHDFSLHKIWSTPAPAPQLPTSKVSKTTDHQPKPTTRPESEDPLLKHLSALNNPKENKVEVKDMTEVQFPRHLGFLSMYDFMTFHNLKIWRKGDEAVARTMLGVFRVREEGKVKGVEKRM